MRNHDNPYTFQSQGNISKYQLIEADQLKRGNEEFHGEYQKLKTLS